MAQTTSSSDELDVVDDPEEEEEEEGEEGEDKEEDESVGSPELCDDCWRATHAVIGHMV